MPRLRHGVPRRRFLRSQLTLGPALATSPRPGESAPSPVAPARSVIILLQEGGMSQLESGDPKPAAPAEIRGSFKSIATQSTGFRIGEHLPRLARHNALYNVVRSAYMDTCTP